MFNRVLGFHRFHNSLLRCYFFLSPYIHNIYIYSYLAISFFSVFLSSSLVWCPASVAIVGKSTCTNSGVQKSWATFPPTASLLVLRVDACAFALGVFAPETKLQRPAISMFISLLILFHYSTYFSASRLIVSFPFLLVFLLSLFTLHSDECPSHHCIRSVLFALTSTLHCTLLAPDMETSPFPSSTNRRNLLRTE